MKKFTFLLVAAVAFLSACNSEKSDLWDSYEIGVTQRNWDLAGGANESGSFYRYIHYDKGITNSLYYNGTIDVYLFDGDTQIKLPYTQYYEEGSLLWSRTIDFDFTVGSVAIYVTYSNFLTQFRPEAMEFRIVKHWH